MSYEQVDRSRLAQAGPRPGQPPLSARPLLAALARIQTGQLDLRLADGSRHLLGERHPGPTAHLQLNRPLALTRRVLLRGALGLAEGYMAGDWEADDLADTLQLLALNQPQLAGLAQGRLAARLTDRLRHLFNANSLAGSRRNIAFHYDLGNDFYRLWLDPTMTYSAAVFARPDEPLAEAQARKYQTMLDRLDARPGDHILEIGCGWGGFACHAARQGFRVTGITLSREQLAWARRRVREEGLEDRVSLELRDYRHLHQRFDHIVSIEMFEAVGEAYWPTYFDTLAHRLKPGGRAALQVITIDEARYHDYCRRPDFIQRYIFPGGMLPSVAAFDREAAAVGLETVSRDFYGHDYALTLRRWDEAVTAQQDRIRGLGYDERFLRLWHYYLAYCEAGFRLGRTNVMQVALARTGD
ncbi:MAG: class I SAM-dependent methyltransferase [Chromatiales bacterium]|nr:class I SAM-dependent methyltransferase [Chromatiales bacterium]